jgi:hypothetical protein
VLQQLVGPITLWLGEASDLDVATCANPKDQRARTGSARTTCAGQLQRNLQGYWPECCWSNVWRPQRVSCRSGLDP